MYGIGKNNIEDAFRCLAEGMGESLQRDDLLNALQTEGENGGMKIQDIEKALTYLVGEQLVTKAVPERVSAGDFAEQILGFEEVDEAELLEEENQFQQSQSAMGGSP